MDLARGADAMMMSSPTQEQRTDLLRDKTEKIWADVYGQKYGKKKQAELKAKEWVSALIKRGQSDEKGNIAFKRYCTVMKQLDQMNGNQLLKAGPENILRYLTERGLIDEDDESDDKEQAVKRFLKTQQEGLAEACRVFEALFDAHMAGEIDKKMKKWCDDEKDEYIILFVNLTCLFSQAKRNKKAMIPGLLLNETGFQLSLEQSSLMERSFFDGRNAAPLINTARTDVDDVCEDMAQTQLSRESSHSSVAERYKEEKDLREETRLEEENWGLADEDPYL